MTKLNLRKALAGVSALTMAAGMAATIGMGAASAETISTDTITGTGMSFIRTVSGDAIVDGAVKVGDQIQITNAITGRNAGLLQWANDEHPSCLTHVPETSTWTVGGTTYSNDGVSPNQRPKEITHGSGWTTLDAPAANSWNAKPLIWTQTYTVNCDAGTLNTGGLNWGSTVGNGTKHSVGPTITVKAATTTGLALSPAPKVGTDTTLTATVAPTTATGKVEFYDGTNKIGAGNLSGGTATYTWKPVTAGANYSVTAKYLGDATNITSTSAAQNGTVAAGPVVKPGAPDVTLDKANATVGETVTATITTVPGAIVKATVNGTTQEIVADSSGIATFPFQPTAAGTTTISVTAGNSAGTSSATTASLTVAAAPSGQLTVAVNPTAPIAGETVKVSISGADANTPVTIKAGDTEVCSGIMTNGTGAATCEWKPTAGTYTLTVTTKVNGAEKSANQTVTVAEKPVVDPGGENPGDTGSAGSLASLSNIFGSLS